LKIVVPTYPDASAVHLDLISTREQPRQEKDPVSKGKGGSREDAPYPRHTFSVTERPADLAKGSEKP
jgi:hypothetical protein